MHARGIGAQRNDVLAQRRRHGEHGVRAQQRPALRLSCQLAQPGAPVGGLFQGQRSVHFQQQRHLQLAGEHRPGRSVERGAFVNKVGRVAVEPSFQVFRQLLIVENPAQLSRQGVVHAQ